MTDINNRLKDLGITLPTPPKPVAAYIPFVRSGHLIHTSGQVPFLDGKLICIGPVPSVVSIDQARAAARQCALNCLAIVSDALMGDLNRVRRIVRLGVWVCCDAGFVDQPKVGNGASELMMEIFGEAGRHARASVGSIALPLGATTEVEMLVEVA
jgi:enamine deaminase RidA (YjgF/YER057c/UK114 family)